MKDTTSVEVYINNMSSGSMSYTAELQVVFNHEKQKKALGKIKEHFPSTSDKHLMALLSDALLGLHNKDFVPVEDSEGVDTMLPAVGLNVVYSMHQDTDNGYCRDLLLDLDPKHFK